MSANKQKPIMKCGHQVQGTTTVKGEKKQVCIICWPKPEAGEVNEGGPNLEGRTARCTYYGSTPCGRNHSSNHGCKRGSSCLCEEPSTKAEQGILAFFKHCPDKPHDEFYCGCFGWE